MHRTHGSLSNFGGTYRSLTPQGSVSDFTLPEEMRESLFCDNTTASVPIFTHDGRLNAEVEGVSQLQFQRLTWFYSLLSISWTSMVLLSGALYVAVVALFAVAYMIMCAACGARTTPIGALYFVVVSISANGGYMGEDVDVLYPGHRCFAQRTYLVMLASYTGILIGALIATTFIAKISMHNKLQHRIVYSDYVTLTQTQMDCFEMCFRVANISARPMVHGRLRLYLVSLRPGNPQLTRHTSKAKAKDQFLRVGSGGGGGPAIRRSTEATSSGGPTREFSFPIPEPTADATALREELDGTSKAEASKLLGAMRSAASGSRSAPADYGSNHPSSASTCPGGTSPAGATIGDGRCERERVQDTSSVGEDLGITPMHMCVEELPWSCDEEMPLPGSEGNLNLWFPVTVRHVVDKDSPLYYALLGKPRPSSGGMYHRGHRHFFHQRMNPTSPSSSSPHRPFRNNAQGGFASPHGSGTGFQIAVVFEATDAATSSIIESKHVYTPDTLIAHYHFAFPTIVSQQPKQKQAGWKKKCVGGAPASSTLCSNIDFYCFNELVADDDEDE